MQVDMSLLDEADSHWGSILDENYEFNHKELLVEAIQKVTSEVVHEKLESFFFDDQQRLNVKLFSQHHAKTNETALRANREFYSALNLELRVIEDQKEFYLENAKYPRENELE